MPELLKFRANDEARVAIVEMLERALERARSGEVLDCAVVLVTRKDDAPVFGHEYWGQSQFGPLIAGVSALQFDMHYHTHQIED